MSTGLVDRFVFAAACLLLAAMVGYDLYRQRRKVVTPNGLAGREIDDLTALMDAVREPCTPPAGGDEKTRQVQAALGPDFEVLDERLDRIWAGAR